MKKLICMLGMGLAITGSAQAQETSSASTPRAYVGAGVTFADRYEGNNKTDLKLFGGYEFDQNLGVEAGFSRYRRVDRHYSLGGGSGSYGAKGYGAYVAAKYSVPIGERFAAYGKLGLAHSQRKYSDSIGFHGKQTDNGVYAALGAQANLSENVALTVEYEHYGENKRFGPKDHQWSAGLKYGF